jgi:hypothetical protein
VLAARSPSRSARAAPASLWKALREQNLRRLSFSEKLRPELGLRLLLWFCFDALSKGLLLRRLGPIWRGFLALHVLRLGPMERKLTEPLPKIAISAR